MDQETQLQWHLLNGALVAPELKPEAVAKVLEDVNAVAEILWNPDTTSGMGIVVLVNDSDAVAAIDGDTAEYRPGLTVAELVKELATRLPAIVTIGNITEDGVPEDAKWPEVPEDSEDLARTVEITGMSAASVPFCAAVEGIDLGCVELGDDRRAVLYEAAEKTFGERDIVSEVPVLSLTVSKDDVRLVAITSEDPSESDHLVHSFSLKAKIVPGAGKLTDAAYEQVRADMGRGQLAKRLLALVPDADVKELAAGLRLRGSDGMRQVVRALHLPADVEAFLLDGKALADVSAVNLHEARGLSNAIGRSVDIMLSQPDSTVGPLWSAYHNFAVERPWMARMIAAAEAAVGATLTTIAVVSKKPRSGWVKLGAVVGAALILDSIAEVSLAKYLGLRAERHEEKNQNN